MIKDELKILEKMKKSEPVTWRNKHKLPAKKAIEEGPFKFIDIIDASSRLDRFAPYIEENFSDSDHGIIESPIIKTDRLREAFRQTYKKDTPHIFAKCDNQLPVAGSIKARGGIHEILAHAESLAIKNGLISTSEDYRIFGSQALKNLFSQHSISVGSTGNLGISIGIISAKLGFKVTVHMSRDAKDWKKELLRSKGVKVVEHMEDYSSAVQKGREQCQLDPKCYFVDDENSKLLFMGYAVAALRLREQLNSASVKVDTDHPLRVYLPCGVGGAPGGITFGLKQIFGDDVECWFIEPTHAPCISLAMVTGEEGLKIKDYGLDGITDADGLAVGSPSRLVYRVCHKLIDGIITVDDNKLYEYQNLIYKNENLKVEPSGASALAGLEVLPPLKSETAVPWFTGGLFLPNKEYQRMLLRGEELLKKNNN